MTELNRWIGIGRLTRDADVTFTKNNTAVSKISIAVNRSVKRGEEWTDEVSFFDVTIFGKTAESLKPYLLKGQQIAVDGHLQQDRWQKDGQNFSKVVIICESLQLLGGKKNNSGDTKQAQEFAPKQSNEEFPEDIPF
jgi:single-strand DNA-binding protein